MKQLNKLIEHLELLSADEKKNSELILEDIDQCVELLGTLRLLSIEVVEAIQNWRFRLSYLIQRLPPGEGVGDHKIPFLLDNENYLLRMKSDTLFLKDSYLGKYINFSSKSDHVLLVPSQAVPKMVVSKVKIRKGKPGKVKKIRKVENRPNLIRLEIEPGLLRKAKDCEMVILEEAVSDFLIGENNTTHEDSKIEESKEESKPEDPKPVEQKPEESKLEEPKPE